ncbi:MAG TPA: PhoH family protein [Sphaerochaeta sp.]|nr:PhoH family protein [Sphaerochaeta sp.]HPK63779.1 PhoH family protein [Sphaerochaeta sp.]
MEKRITFDSEELVRRVLGINDRNIPYMETLLGCELFVRSNDVICLSDDPLIQNRFLLLFGRLSRLAEHQLFLNETDIFMEFQSIKNDVSQDRDVVNGDRENRKTIKIHNRRAYAKGANQERYVELMEENKIVFAIGPAGTGKTFLAVAYALSQLFSGRKRKIILTRPIVEAGESLGFLPGDLAQKINPYLRPLYDAMELLISPANIRKLEDGGNIEIAPLAYMRGRSLRGATVILDEAQNTTVEQMHMFLTRLGEDSKAIVTGDISQIDLPKSKMSGLVHAEKILQGIDELAFAHFTSSDVVRSRIVQAIIDAYQNGDA